MSSQRDWRDNAPYDLAETLPSPGIAWEFLRRDGEIERHDGRQGRLPGGARKRQGGAGIDRHTEQKVASVVGDPLKSYLGPIQLKGGQPGWVGHQPHNAGIQVRQPKHIGLGGVLAGIGREIATPSDPRRGRLPPVIA